MIRIVFDTNILVSSLIKRGKPRLLWDFVLSGRLQLILSKQILEEFVKVVSREKFRKYITKSDVRIFLEAIRDIGNFVRLKRSFNIIKEDPSDNVILSTAYDSKSNFIVSGDKHLLNLKEFKGIKIVNAGEMLEILRIR